MSDELSGPRDINPGYAAGQLARAWRAAEAAGDAEARARAEARAESWRETLTRIIDGALKIGARAPVGGAPPWLTLEVLQGGFASGRLLAERPLSDAEQTLLEAQGRPADARDRAALNAWFLTEPGLAQLDAWLESGAYIIELPEDGALLSLAWLLREGRREAAAALLDELGPFLDRIRFSPQPADAPVEARDVVAVTSVGALLAELDRLEDSPRILAQAETLSVWMPLYDEAIDLVCESVEGPLPAVSAAGVVTGGWPFQRLTEGWRERADALLERVADAREAHLRCGKPESSRSTFARLLEVIGWARWDELSGSRVGRARRTLAGALGKRGAAGSERRAGIRAAQAAQLATPSRRAFARLLSARLAPLPASGGIPEPEALSGAVTADEAGRFELREGAALPAPFARRLRRAWEAPVAALIDAGVIGSLEVLAKVLPQLTVSVAAAAYEAPQARRLAAGIDAAMRRRRSLLLLNLERQTRLEDLPWYAALAPWKAARMSAKQRAAQTLRRLLELAIGRFPQVILPNPMVEECRRLVGAAGWELPLTNELAADIFMGTFTAPFLAAAQRAGEALRGSLYERYYGLDYARVAKMRAERGRGRGVPAFAAYCVELAGGRRGGWSAAENGRIIEQQQLLTTHNLAPLILAAAPELDFEALARRALIWCRAELARPVRGWRPQLQRCKGVAYGWRQMLILLSLAPAEARAGFLAWGRGELPEDDRLRPAWRGVERAARGEAADAGGGMRLLGWSKGAHPLMA